MTKELWALLDAEIRAAEQASMGVFSEMFARLRREAKEMMERDSRRRKPQWDQHDFNIAFARLEALVSCFEHPIQPGDREYLTTFFPGDELRSGDILDNINVLANRLRRAATQEKPPLKAEMDDLNAAFDRLARAVNISEMRQGSPQRVKDASDPAAPTISEDEAFSDSRCLVCGIDLITASGERPLQNTPLAELGVENCLCGDHAHILSHIRGASARAVARLCAREYARGWYTRA